jgi:hypothetical protein
VDSGHSLVHPSSGSSQRPPWISLEKLESRPQPNDAAGRGGISLAGYFSFVICRIIRRLACLTSHLGVSVAVENGIEKLLAVKFYVSDPTNRNESERHPPLDGIEPSPRDAKRMLEAYIGVELAGRVVEEARRHARSVLDPANGFQPRRIAAFRDAAMCVEATTTVINVIAIVAGRRDPR